MTIQRRTPLAGRPRGASETSTVPTKLQMHDGVNLEGDARASVDSAGRHEGRAAQ
jgi:hypothetical protein